MTNKIIKWPFIFLMFVGFTVNAQPLKIRTEWFNLGGNFIYSVEDGYTGLNGKLTLPLGDNISFQGQGTLFPAQLQLSEETFDETRAKFGIEIIPVRAETWYISFQTGFDYGFWRRNFEVKSSQIGLDWKRDESMMFGGAFNYNYNRFRFYVDYMYMPEIFSNHIGVGMYLLFFESKRYKRLYLQRRTGNSSSWWRIRQKGSKGKSKT